MSRTTARLLALAAALLFSTGGAAIKTGVFDAAQVSSVRSGIAALALFVWLGGRVTWSNRAILIGLVYATVLTLFVSATKLTTAANAIFLQSTAPLYIVLLGPLILGEHVRRRDLVYMAVVAAGIGLCVIGQPPPSAIASNPRLGNLLGLLCSLMWGITLMALRSAQRSARPDHEVPSIGVSAVVLGNLFACALALPFAWPFPPAPAVEWGMLLYLGVFQIGLAYLCLTTAMRQLPALEVSLLLLLEPVLNPVWTWVMRGEAAGQWVVAGGMLILTATAAKAVMDARAERREVAR